MTSAESRSKYLRWLRGFLEEDYARIAHVRRYETRHQSVNHLDFT